MNFTSKSLDAFRTEFNTAVADLAKRHGVIIDLGRITYNDTSFRCKMEVRNIEQGQEGKSLRQIKAEQDFNTHCHLFDMTKDDFGKTFTSNGKTFAISGLNLKAKKYPIVATEVGTTNNYRFPEEVVDRLDAVDVVDDIKVGKWYELAKDGYPPRGVFFTTANNNGEGKRLVRKLKFMGRRWTTMEGYTAHTKPTHWKA